MTEPPPPVSSTKTWRELRAHGRVASGWHVRELFRRDRRRFDRFSVDLDDMLLDYSKNPVSVGTMRLLRRLARETDVAGWARRMFAGEKINTTENRAVLHAALRYRGSDPIVVDGRDVMPAVRTTLRRMRDLDGALARGELRGHTGRPIDTLVHIGIGGSDLGPQMAVEALASYRRPRLDLRFLANVDSTPVARLLTAIDPERTLAVVASKTFATAETMTNAATLRAWLIDKLGSAGAVRSHMIGVSTNGNAVRDFGIAEDRFLPFWDWVGGRYSLWSAVGLPIVLAIGADNFDRLLDGAYAMDRHFLEARPESNLPLTLALIGIWHINFLGAAVHGVFPYDQGLARFHAYLQQLDMESNGKSVDRYGRCLRIATSPIVFGEPGTNGQHSFFQHLHQGTVPVPCDFLLAAEPHVELGAHHGILMANAVAQSEALMRGKTEAEVRADMQARGLERPMVDALVAHRTFAGNRASNTILYRRLDPFTLGRLVALYEHKVFAQGVVWGVNSFDQWGVELGKELAAEVETGLSVGRSSDGHDASTRGLIDRIGKLRSRR